MTMREKTGLALYMHAGSGNHGCEAIADSLLRQISLRRSVTSQITSSRMRPITSGGK